MNIKINDLAKKELENINLENKFIKIYFGGFG